MTKFVQQEMFSDARIALHQEIRNHPELIKRLNNHPVDEFEVRMAEVCNYCEVILHGDYLPSDFDNIADICVKKLVAMRTPLIFPS